LNRFSFVEPSKATLEDLARTTAEIVPRPIQYSMSSLLGKQKLQFQKEKL